jgi:hypothetical protein
MREAEEEFIRRHQADIDWQREIERERQEREREIMLEEMSEE